MKSDECITISDDDNDDDPVESNMNSTTSSTYVSSLLLPHPPPEPDPPLPPRQLAPSDPRDISSSSSVIKSGVPISFSTSTSVSFTMPDPPALPSDNKGKSNSPRRPNVPLPLPQKRLTAGYPRKGSRKKISKSERREILIRARVKKKSNKRANN